LCTMLLAYAATVSSAIYPVLKRDGDAANSATAQIIARTARLTNAITQLLAVKFVQSITRTGLTSLIELECVKSGL
jgi:hypothetical protein